MEEVINRWLQLYRGPDVVARFVLGESLADEELEVVQGLAETWRGRLYDVSWFMSYLNYYIALPANKDDGCTGRFREGCFISQALLDEADKKGCISRTSPKLLTTLHLSPDQWKLLAKEVQKESTTMLNGLNKVASVEKRQMKKVVLEASWLFIETH